VGALCSGAVCCSCHASIHPYGVDTSNKVGVQQQSARHSESNLDANGWILRALDLKPGVLCSAAQQKQVITYLDQPLIARLPSFQGMQEVL